MSAPAVFENVAGSGRTDLRVEALKAIDAIVDPCSAALGRPIGLVGMGMIAELSEQDGQVDVLVLPTFPTCMFRGVFEEEIQSRVGKLAWVRAVAVRFAAADDVWDETRMSEEARAKLGRRRRAA